ncbi:MAG: Na+/H+ antiporter NhaC family protein [Bacillota bacterium]|nr:Na+/H+ antiporter NhaC family protein [Bacillota bacterium]
MLLFTSLGLKKLKERGSGFGEGIRELSKWSWGSIKDSLVVIEVMLIIGFITAAWRISGTITIFVYYGMKVIVPPLFLIIAFLLSCLLSYALGTSFGVAGTLGVIFMALARSGGVDPLITAGVVMSGIYFGDRGSPVSSSANMVAGVTKTDIMENVKLMMKTAALPFGITVVLYAVLSFMHPISHVDTEIVQAFENEFTLSPWGFLPAVLMLLLPLLKVGVIQSISVSILSSVAIAWLVEKVSLIEIIKILFIGYHASGDGLGTILNGGGLCSMLEIAAILVISCAYSGIFTCTDMLRSLLDYLEQCCTKAGRLAVTFFVSVATCFVFCNQTIATLMCNDLLTGPYLSTGGTRQELAIDMENTVIIIVGLIPWCIACSVPLTFFGVGIGALPWAFYMYLVPACWFFTKKRWFLNRAPASKGQHDR